MTWDDGTPYVDELTDGLYAYVQPVGGWMVNDSGIIVDGSGRSVLIDTLATEKRNRSLLAEVGRVSPGGPQIAVNTHHHPDHTWGNGFLPADTVLIAQDECRPRMIAAGLKATQELTEPDYGDLSIRPPEFTFSDRMTLHLNDFPVELRYVGTPAHTTNDVLVWVPDRKVIFAGDLAFNGGQPFVLEGSIAGFRTAIGQMRALAPAIVVPGHGPVCRDEEITRMFDGLDSYLSFVQEVAAEGHAAGLSPLEAAVKHRDNPYSGWMETERFVGNLHRAYAEIPGWEPPVPLIVPGVMPDMVAFVGGPIVSHA